MDDNLIPLFGIFCLFGLPMIGWILGRIMKHRERMEMLRMGMMPPPTGRDARWASRMGAPGMAPPPGPLYAQMRYDDSNDPQCMLRRGIVTTMVGFALLIGLSFIGYRGGDGLFSPATIHPGPWLLGGLIPMFVGIGQIIIALMSGAQWALRIVPPPGSSMPPPPGGYRSATAQPGSPGPRYEELARPVPPPDRQ